ncbi:hypothetical protein CF392_08295 [Tamilnaduibacter salinus]|uniref:Response regulatory domain-containing protein n=1 Tax=Tamilnaduibacter salinus TaxID=1484056 RepID=A0A2A2I306_9GAMM|nr:response regulator [Tamilnaduibacter salinus]PAV25962.1 hypothetical protein CF392_08295 [Tamilnaduibacter salinus]
MNLERILCIEDEVDIRTVVDLALSTVGAFTVRLCDSGDGAVDAARDFRPDLILLDVMMPGMDGPQTLAALKGDPELSGIPVVFMTAKVQPYEVEEYLQQGAIDVIAKPFDPMTLADRVSTIWARWCREGVE